MNDKPLRFFKAPLPGPHLVWHAAEDLHACLDLPRSLRREFRQKLRSSEWSADVRTVATADGIVTIAPHFMAQGLIGAMIEVGRARPESEMAYARQAAAAFNALSGDLPPLASFDLMIAAYRNTNKLDGDAPTPGGAA